MVWSLLLDEALESLDFLRLNLLVGHVLNCAAESRNVWSCVLCLAEI